MGFVYSLIWQSPRQRLLQSLRGRTFTIPDLPSAFAHWPQGVHPEMPRLAGEVDRTIIRFYHEPRIFRKMKEADAASFGAMWWPYASFDRLCIATYLSMWLFAWDDETDSTEISHLVHQTDKAARFREQTREFIHACLSCDKEGPSELPVDGLNNPFIASFQVVGEAITRSCNEDQVNRFRLELDKYIDMAGLEQNIQMTNHLPTVDEYWNRRKGSSAVGVCLAITEYCYAMEIPPNIMGGADMRRLWDLINIIVSSTNDILSLKKEIAQGQTDSLVPILYLQYGSLQTAVDEAADMIFSSAKEFDQLAEKLLSSQPEDDAQDNLRKFIDGCRYCCSANLNWSLRSKRFKLNAQSLQSGFEVTLSTN
ncbi:terpenoid synthase [Aspergillus steynii IBT 23096]|uniref:Terpene synthase n=1 Tax=Aspergillus steynii IBT 23096 TaxID=1392250 RepID=A0A2I2GEV1_9EURO|nr:terpenoid synthase [Aspergillus steynii IBT 23096]PLB51409.1 terpenoid synthase [Aspergillus steynii IBT 23096]